jgi:hypothetical protein
MTRIRFIPVFLLLCIGFSCRDLYDPGLKSSSEFYLVVEGVLNAGNGPTNIRLTRTFKLDDSATLRAGQCSHSRRKVFAATNPPVVTEFISPKLSFAKPGISSPDSDFKR